MDKIEALKEQTADIRRTIFSLFGFSPLCSLQEDELQCLLCICGDDLCGATICYPVNPDEIIHGATKG